VWRARSKHFASGSSNQVLLFKMQKRSLISTTKMAHKLSPSIAFVLCFITDFQADADPSLCRKKCSKHKLYSYDEKLNS
jgi:hypothetical protein